MEVSEKTDVTVQSGVVGSLGSNRDIGMNVRVVLPTGIGFASTNGVSKEIGKAIVDKAFKLARNVDLKVPISFSDEPAVTTNWSVSESKPIVDMTIDDRVEFLKGIDKSIIGSKVKVQGRFLQLRDAKIESYFANSEGSRISSHLPRLRFDSYMVVTSKGQSEQSSREWGGTGGWEVAEGWDLPSALDKEVHMLKKMIEHGKPVKLGKYDLICGPEVAGIAAHESCGHPMEADRILGREMSQAGKSFVSPGMIGSRIGSEYATVIDDPTVRNSYGYYAYDQEGVKARPRHLYKEGIINEFYTNRETAGRLDTTSNGSSRSETYLQEPIVRMANTYVAPGDFEDDEIFGSVKSGVLMHSFTEWNIDDKRFNQKYVSREAYFIKDGELAEPARKCVLEITTPEFWGSLDAVSKNVEYQAAECGKGDPIQSMAVFTGGPMMRLRGGDVILRSFKDTAEEIVQKARSLGADDVICEVIESRTNQIRYSSNRIDASNMWREHHAVLFVAIGKRNFVTDLRDINHALDAVPDVVQAARIAPENRNYSGIPGGRFKYKRSPADKKITDLRSPAKFVYDAISGAESEGAIEVGGTFFARHNKAGIASSGGAYADDESASVELSVRAFSEPEASGHAICCVPRLAKMDARGTGVRAGTLAKSAKNPMHGDVGRTDIIVEPLFLGSLTHSTSDMMSAFAVDIGMSMFAKKLGKKVMSDEVTFVDDPTIISTSRRSFDHEGVPTRRNVVIKDGILKTYLHNTSTAKKFKTKSTSNMGSLIPIAFNFPGQPYAFHPIIESGSWKTDELIEDTKSGLYLNNAWYTRFQSYSKGDFSTIPRDAILQIRDGEIVGSVKNIRVSDNMLNLWKNVDGITKAAQEVFWWDEASPPSTLPWLRMRKANITRSA